MASSRASTAASTRTAAPAQHERPDRQHVRLLHGEPGRLHRRLVGSGLHEQQQPHRRPAERLPGREHQCGLRGAPAATGIGRRRLHPERSDRRTVSCRSRWSTSRWPGSSTRSSASACSAATRSPTAVLHQPGRRRRRSHRHSATLPRRRRRPARHEVRRRRDRREVLGGGRDAAEERRQRASAHGLRPRRRHPRHRVEREPHGRRPDQRGLDRLHRPRRGQPAGAAQAVQRQPERVHVRPGQRPDGTPIPCSVLSTTRTRRRPAGCTCRSTAAPPTQGHACDRPHAPSTGNRSRRSHTTVVELPLRPTHTYTFAIRRPARRQQDAQLPAERRFYVPPSNTYRWDAAAQRAERERHVRLRQQREPGDAVAPVNGAQRNLNAVTANVYGATVPGNADERRLHRQALLTHQATGSTGHDGDDLRGRSRRSAGTRYRAISLDAAPHATGDPRTRPVASFRFAFSRVAGDQADAAAAAVGKSKALVFVNTGSGTSTQRRLAGRARRTTATRSRRSPRCRRRTST